MAKETARQAMLKQLSYALAVQTLVEQNTIPSPDSFITAKHRQTTDQASEHLIEAFERVSLVDEVKKITDSHGYLYGVFQGVVRLFATRSYWF